MVALCPLHACKAVKETSITEGTCTEYRRGKSRMLRERQVGHVFDEKSKVLMGNSGGGE